MYSYTNYRRWRDHSVWLCFFVSFVALMVLVSALQIIRSVLLLSFLWKDLQPIRSCSDCQPKSIFLAYPDCIQIDFRKSGHQNFFFCRSDPSHIWRWSEMRFQLNFYRYTQQRHQIQSDGSTLEWLDRIHAATSSGMEDNTENNSPRTEAEINCLLALWGGGFYKAKAGRRWKAASQTYVVTDAYVVTTATHTDRLMMSGSLTVYKDGQHDSSPLMAGHRIGHKSRPLHVSRWDMGQTKKLKRTRQISFSQRWFLAFLVTLLMLYIHVSDKFHFN